MDIAIEKLDTVDSTNDYITREVDDGEIISDKIVISKHQSNGHGTNGKSFISDKDVGIYFTLLHFYKNESELNFITQKSAVAVYNTFDNLFNIELKIKWVNDLYYNDKKICGILCRNLIKHKAVIIGIGIDLYKNININDDIKNIAGYIFENEKDLSSRFKCDFNSSGIGKDVSEIIVLEIVKNIYSLINISGLPKIYIEKNIIKDKKVYEDCILEC